MNKKVTVLFLFCALALGAFGALPGYAATMRIVDSTQMDLSAINAVEASRGIPVGTVIAWGSPGNPDDADKWLECNGTSTAGYPELAAIVGAKTPDYRDQFLRGGGTGQVGQVTADTTRSHFHSQPTHTHTVNTMLSSTALSGTAAAQTVKDNHTGFGRGATGGFGVMNGYTAGAAGNPSHSHVMTPNEIAWSYIDSQTHTTEGPSAVSGQLVSGAASGTAAAGGGNDTYVNSNSDGTTGGAETAPQHTRVRYLIRALP